MNLSWLKYPAFGLVILSLFSCGVTEQRDAAPSRPPAAADMRDAVPRAEPPSRYGNMVSYEVFGKRYYTLASSEGYVERGMASWYGKKFHGRRTSSGEPYDMYKMTAAHKTLPLPSYAEVTNLENGRKVIVRINDRGPFHGDRIIDLSYSAATKLGIVGRGTGKVEVRAIEPHQQARTSTPAQTTTASKAAQPVTAPAAAQEGPFFIQVGAFSNSYRAEEIRAQISEEVSDPVEIMPLSRPQGQLYRVRVGPLASLEVGNSVANRLMRMGFTESRIVVE
jgi:rare lipoprotein A